MLLDKLKQWFSKPKHNGLYKQADGYYRWIGIVTNNYLDSDGEILTDEAHRKFYSFLQDNPDILPAKLIWHTPGTQSKHGVDFAYYDDGFFIYSGVLELDEAEPYLNDYRPLGMSHGFIALERDFNNPRYITEYFTYEVSDLLLEQAANPLTSFTVMSASELIVRLADAIRISNQPANALLLTQTT